MANKNEDVHLKYFRFAEEWALEDIEPLMPKRAKLIDLIPVYGMVKAWNRKDIRNSLRTRKYCYKELYTFEDRNHECKINRRECFKDEFYSSAMFALNLTYGLTLGEIIVRNFFN